MAKKKISPIRITQKDEIEYKKLVASSKRKVRDVNKKYGVDLSTEVEFKKLSDFDNRTEYNVWKDKLKSFTNRNNLNYQFVKNEYGVVATKAEINKVQSDVKRAQRLADKINKEVAKKPRVVHGGQISGTLGQKMLQMSKPNLVGAYRPKDFNFKEIRNRQRFEEVADQMGWRSNPKYRDERTEKMRERYVEKLRNTFNSDADNLIKLIMEMNVEDFYDMYQMIDEFDFNEIYIEDMLSDLGMHTSDLTSRLEDYVVRYQRGDFPSLKEF